MIQIPLYCNINYVIQSKEVQQDFALEYHWNKLHIFGKIHPKLFTLH